MAPNIHFEDHGPKDAPAIVFVHGLALSLESWRPQIEVLRQTHRVLAVDLRGHGKSELGDAPFTIDFFCDDVEQAMDRAGVRKAVICGLSMGGYVAFRMVERTPERVHALVLCDTRAEADTNEAKIKRTASIQLIQSRGVEPWAKLFVPALFSPKTMSSQPTLVENIRTWVLANPARGIQLTQLALAARTDSTELLSRIQVPTLIVCGEDDGVTPPALSRAMHERVAGSVLELIPDAGHLSNLEAPLKFDRTLIQFIKSLGTLA